jgi:Uma2 family endonuclease
MGVSTAALTVEEFLNVPEPEGQRIELLEGEIISVGLGGYEHELVKANVNRVLTAWSLGNPAGKVFVETTFRLDQHTSLMPDVSFLLASRLVPGTRGLIQGAPELAVEIVSSESASVLERKISLYLAHGGRAVWAIYPEHRAVRVYDLNGFSRRLGADDVLEDQQLLPGFRTPVAAMFEGV